ncbi:hypothetical protein FQN60_008235 [Etheostoma spectabile]|uniref:Uncharacterized protein n=1 Tax=Etheostoma spectabile TaxID=54343 RepID=A0A5J5CV76_9PERO|nr:hypothetical protein FQN60_008235 [Etheostoma spectabile]
MPPPNANLLHHNHHHNHHHLLGPCSTMPVYQSQTAVAQSGHMRSELPAKPFITPQNPPLLSCTTK